jgi:hypothetical protein
MITFLHIFFRNFLYIATLACTALFSVRPKYLSYGVVTCTLHEARNSCLWGFKRRTSLIMALMGRSVALVIVKG